MKVGAVLLVAGLALQPLAVCADEAPVSASVSPWVDDLALINQTKADVQEHGVLAVEKYRQKLEDALANAKHAIALASAARPTSFVLTDGMAESIVAMGMVVADKSTGVKSVSAVENPYPSISFYLGTYYDEVGKPDDALRVLEAGLGSYSVEGIDLGENVGPLLAERSAALEALHRWQDVLQNADRGLKIDDLDNKLKAHFYRARGYAYTELKQLDDAEDAYKESLNLDPGNKIAEGELKYIAGLKLGAPATAPGALTKVQKTAPVGDGSSAQP